MLGSGCAPHEKRRDEEKRAKFRVKLGARSSTLEAKTDEFIDLETNLSRDIAVIVAPSHAHSLSPATAKVTFFEQSAKEEGVIYSFVNRHCIHTSNYSRETTIVVCFSPLIFPPFVAKRREDFPQRFNAYNLLLSHFVNKLPYLCIIIRSILREKSYFKEIFTLFSRRSPPIQRGISPFQQELYKLSYHD